MARRRRTRAERAADRFARQSRRGARRSERAEQRSERRAGRQFRGAFKGLGLGREERKGARAAARGGTLTEYLSGTPIAERMFRGRLEQGIGGRRRRRRGARAAEAGGFEYEGMPLGAEEEIEDEGEEEVPPEGPPLTLEELIEAMGGGPTPGVGPALEGVGGQIEGLGAGPKLPTFEEMFSNWQDVAQRETNRQAGGIAEAFGSRGARYGSELLGAQKDLRTQMGERANLAANQIATGLRGQRQGELNTLMGQKINLLGMNQQSRQSALQRLFLDAMRSTGLPPGYQSAVGVGAGVGPGDTIGYY